MKEFKITDRFTPRDSKILYKYFNEIERYKILTSDEEFELAQIAFTGDQEAVNKLVNSNLRFVITVAKMYSTKTDTFTDLIAAGNVGLIDAAKKFDPSKGFKFISYAVWHIRKEMIKYLSDNSRTIRIPVNKSADLKTLRGARDFLMQDLLREPSSEEVIEYAKNSDKFSIKTEDLNSMIKVMGSDLKTSSLDEPLNSEDASNLHDLIHSVDHQTDKDVYNDDILEGLRDILSSLSSIDSFIVKMRHGIDTPGGNCETFETIGESLGISPGKVRQKYVKSMKILKYNASRNVVNKSDFFHEM